MKERTRRNFWMPSEIDMMLKLLQKLHPAKSMAQSTSHNAFVAIANKMKKCGMPNKTALQIRRKWFQMKSAYLCYKRGNVERLLLIPECFRQTIAQFVDAEIKCHKLPPKTYNAIKAEPKSVPEISTPPAATTAIKTTPTTHLTKTHKHKNDYQKMLEDFAASNSKAHKLMLGDFKRMQEKMLNYQQEYQMIRDANVRAFLDNMKINFEA